MKLLEETCTSMFFPAGVDIMHDGAPTSEPRRRASIVSQTPGAHLLEPERLMATPAHKGVLIAATTVHSGAEGGSCEDSGQRMAHDSRVGGNWRRGHG
jgi:hypothetical protein